MLIRSTPYACFVMLRNGLTLEIVYDRKLIGDERESDTLIPELDDLPAAASCGVWLMGETVLTEVVAGQA